jgi:hypothetical protein
MNYYLFDTAKDSHLDWVVLYRHLRKQRGLAYHNYTLQQVLRYYVVSQHYIPDNGVHDFFSLYSFFKKEGLMVNDIRTKLLSRDSMGSFTLDGLSMRHVFIFHSPNIIVCQIY